MRRKAAIGGPAYAASALGVLLVGVIALLVMQAYPATGLVLLLAVLIALAGIGLRWRRHIIRRRHRHGHDQIQI